MLAIARTMLVTFAACFALVAQANAIDLSKLDLEDVLVMQLRAGTVLIEMRPDKAPNHVMRIKELVRQKFYDGLTFHRVLDGFMAQTGDPRGDGTGGSGRYLDAEFNRLRHTRGTASMARGADDVNSADSQFFIMLNTNFTLNGQYTVWGRVVDGMKHVDDIKKGDPQRDGAVDFPDKIITLRVAADVMPAQQ